MAFSVYLDMYYSKGRFFIAISMHCSYYITVCTIILNLCFIELFPSFQIQFQKYNIKIIIKKQKNALIF